jgi:hypothetical protein
MTPSLAGDVLLLPLLLLAEPVTACAFAAAGCRG